ncbi:MAG TPA: hypothetical protein VG649_13490 [Candidatus Angelobacter sp.]|jgi:hypothetical protein|nr:hypothetical protein [Candidatus Angelobacter sp.]
MSIQPNDAIPTTDRPTHAEPNYRQVFPDLSRFVPIFTLESVSASAQGAARHFEPSNSLEFRVMKSQPSSFKSSHLCPSVPIRAHFSTDMARPGISSRLMAQEYPGV